MRNLSSDVSPRSAGTLYRARVRQDWPDNRDFRILSIDGGGIRGILPLAALARLERDFLQGGSIARYFDLIAGTSTGGIIALGLASGLTANEILEIYLKRGGEVFPDYGFISKKVRSIAQIFGNRCDTSALYNLIDELVGAKHLWESQNRLCIPAAEVKNFQPFIFKTPHHSDYRKDWSLSMAHVAKATSAAPAHFSPLHSPDGYTLIDGGIWANNPVMVAVVDVLACFDIKREQIKVLSLGCGETLFRMSWMRHRLGGLIFWTGIMFESMQIQSQNVVGQARLTVGGDRVLRVEAGPFNKPIELWNWARAKIELPELGEELISSLGDLPSKLFLTDEALPFSPIYSPSSPPQQKLL